jgi:hypothetical protein
MVELYLYFVLFFYFAYGSKDTFNHFGTHSNQNSSHILSSRRTGDNGGLKVLIIQADNRKMRHNLNDDQYVGMAAVLLNDYAFNHGYDFLRFTGSTKGIVGRIRSKYKDKMTATAEPRDMNNNKRGASSFHPGFMQYRASSWAKLPHVWHAVTTYGRYYDYIWFMDSDAVINPKFRNRSLFDSLQIWKNKESSIAWGLTDPFKADILFFSNFPFREDLPCAGIFIVKPNKTEQSLREWWDYR